MAQVIILRHGQTNTPGILKGSYDIADLSDEGLLTTIVTAQEIRRYVREHNITKFYFGGSPYKRTKQTRTIAERVISLVGKGDKDVDYLPPDTIYQEMLFSARPIEIKSLQERDFGSLQGHDHGKIEAAVLKITAYPTLHEFLLYGDCKDFVAVAIELGIEKPKPGEGYYDTFQRAYDVSEDLIEKISEIDTSRERSLIVLSNHEIFGCYLSSAIPNTVSSKHFPEVFKGDLKYGRHLLTDYEIQESRFTRVEITMRADKTGILKPHCIIKEINDRGHLDRIKHMKEKEQIELINQAKAILVGNAE